MIFRSEQNKTPQSGARVLMGGREKVPRLRVTIGVVTYNILHDKGNVKQCQKKAPKKHNIM
jgi:hypothetical protein